MLQYYVRGDYRKRLWREIKMRTFNVTKNYCKREREQQYETEASYPLRHKITYDSV